MFVEILCYTCFMNMENVSRKMMMKIDGSSWLSDRQTMHTVNSNC